MIENIIVSFTNFAAFLPILTAAKQGDDITSFTLIFAFSTSFFFHLIENHKHGMPGIGFSRFTSKFWNNMDLISVFFVVYIMSSLYYHKYGFQIPTNKETISIYSFKLKIK